VVDMNPNFGYAKKNDKGVFVSTNELGIRAITSMVYGETGEKAELYTALDEIAGANGMLVSDYQALANNKSYMNALSSMMAGYIVENVFYPAGNKTILDMIEHAVIEKAHVQQFQYMYYDMALLLLEQAKQTVAMLNLNAKIRGVDISITVEELMNMPYSVKDKTAYNTLKTRGFTTVADNTKTVTLLKEIDQFLSDYHVIVEDHDRLGELYDSITSDQVAWLSSKTVSADSSVLLIDDIIDRLVDLKKCTIANYKGQTMMGIGGNQPPIAIGSTGQSGSVLAKLTLGGPCETVITNGILKRFDNRTGGRIANPAGTPLVINAGGQTLKSNVSTDATENYFENERAYLFEQIGGAGMALIAQDVYGFAVDFWIRTNAQGSFLTLQGNVLTREDTIEVFGKNREGEEVPLYTISVTKEEGESLLDRVVVSYDIYQSTQVIEEVNEETGEVTEQTVPCWRYAERHAVVEEEYVSQYTDGKLPPRKVETIKTVIGYEGDNRVWEGDEHSSLTVNSSTQGSGSCYVFYAENPVDQKRIKELLKSMKVAFVDDQGEFLANASMNVELSYENAGKVIVPLMLDDDSFSIGKNENGENIYTITSLERNVPKRITAIFYLDGEQITNSEVLASADIRGQMNIQFGSSVMLKPLGNEPLYNSEIHLDAALEGKTTFEYGVDKNMTVTVRATIDGTTPSTVEAFFMRRINATQGSPEAVFTLSPTAQEGVYEGTFTFQYPGEYILRSIRVDGLDRDLQVDAGEDYPTVVVNGYTITSVSYLGITNGMKIMTDAGSYSATSTLKFAAADPDKMPKKVAGQFLRDDGSVATVNYKYDATEEVWKGTVTFVSSGEYTMQFVMLDGEYTELSEAFWCTVDLTLGMRVKVSTVSPTQFLYDPEAEPNALHMNVQILDNGGKAVTGITRAELYYSAGGANDLHTDLTWNDSTEQYQGEFDEAAGIWKFNKVVVYSGDSQNELRSVNADAPVFTIIPPTPPSHYTNLAESAQFVKSGMGSVKVTLKDSEAATVYGKFVRKRGNDTTTRYIPVSSMSQTGENQYTYNFDMESGIWELVAVSAFNVIDDKMVLHSLPVDENGAVKAVETEEEFNSGMVFDEFDSLNTSVLLSQDVTISVSYADGTFDSVVAGATTVGQFGKEGNTVTASFMQSHSIEANEISVKFSDPYGLIGTVFTINASDIVMHYDFEGTPDAKYGGYTTTESVWGSFSPGKVTLSAGADARTFTNAAITFQYAGRYAIENANNEGKVDYSVTYIDNNGTERKTSVSQTPVGAYAVEVWSKKPTVKITSQTPSAGSTVDVDMTGEGTDHTEGVIVPAKSDTEATVYFTCSTGKGVSGCNTITTHNYSRPSVTITLDGIGQAGLAELLFGTNVHIYDGTKKTTGYSWTSNTFCSRNIGYYANKQNATDTKTPAGDLVATELVLTYDGMRFSIPTLIKIHNPY